MPAQIAKIGVNFQAVKGNPAVPISPALCDKSLQPENHREMTWQLSGGIGTLKGKRKNLVSHGAFHGSHRELALAVSGNNKTTILYRIGFSDKSDFSVCNSLGFLNWI